MIPNPPLPDPTQIRIAGGSFRDPSGYVFRAGDRIFRTVNPIAAEPFAALEASGLIRDLEHAGLILPAAVVPLQPALEHAFAGARGETPVRLIEHPLVPLITYPYEWCFSQLKDAALAHLDLQITALDRGFVLSDATPYNMQFWQGRAVHIDTLSLRPYREGELWQGYNQFCRLFLAPLLIEAWAGVGFQPLLRGKIEGIALAEAAALLPKRRLFTSMQGFLHVHLHGKSESSASSSRKGGTGGQGSMQKSRYSALLTELRHFVAGLASAKRSKSFWEEYATVNSYSDAMRERKAAIVRDFVSRHSVRSVVDIGGNTGDYSMAALEAGAENALVLDGDNDSVEIAYERSKRRIPGLQAFLVDIADPSPGIGWQNRERDPLPQRIHSDGVLGLAVIHHMCIGRNIPLRSAVHWLVSLAPRGIIEFVPKTDAMVKQMLSARDDVFSDYDHGHFLAYLGEVATVGAPTAIEGTERTFVEFGPR
jgi:ribosomal protein L11 methylase PrmA